MECYNVGGCSRLSRIKASGAIHSADIHSEVCLFGMQLSGHLKSCARARAKIYCTRSWDVHLSITLPQHFPFIKIFILSFLIVLRIVPGAHGILWWEDYSCIVHGEHNTRHLHALQTSAVKAVIVCFFSLQSRHAWMIVQTLFIITDRASRIHLYGIMPVCLDPDATDSDIRKAYR